MSCEGEVTMKIDLDRLTESELIDLNHRIVARLRMFTQLRAHASMLEFKVGERVSFDAEDGRRITGMLVRYNKKTVSLVTDDGHRWNVSPALLKRVAPMVKPSSSNAQSQNVLAFRKE
jgi:hypothetical protein